MSHPHDAIKVVIVGDGMVGKTSMLVSYAENRFDMEYVPTVFDNQRVELYCDGEIAHLHLWDTAGQEDYDRLRPLSYPDTDVFLVCFSIDSRTSFDSVLLKWILELRHCHQRAPIILVGTKSDLRRGAMSDRFVTKDEAVVLAKKVKAVRYMECSALTREGLLDIFEEVVRTHKRPKRRHRKRCSIL